MILSLEVHCGIEQQQVMAQILRDTLGSTMIISPINDSTVLPSPAQLVNKIIIKVCCFVF